MTRQLFGRKPSLAQRGSCVLRDAVTARRPVDGCAELPTPGPRASPHGRVLRTPREGYKPAGTPSYPQRDGVLAVKSHAWRTGMASAGELDLTLVMVGVGAAASPRFAPAGLLVEFGKSRVLIDGSPTNFPDGRFDAWLVTDEHSELIAAIRRQGIKAMDAGLKPAFGEFGQDGQTYRLKPAHEAKAAEPRTSDPLG